LKHGESMRLVLILS